ncbi:hypothetical protein Tco_1251795 [Tanacetum coccineum]
MPVMQVMPVMHFDGDKDDGDENAGHEEDGGNMNDMVERRWTKMMMEISMKKEQLGMKEVMGKKIVEI